MMKMNKSSRKLSEFMCREMLYDFATGHLDEERARAVQEFLKENEILKNELMQMKSALEYCDQAGGITVSELLYLSLSERDQVFKSMKQKLSWKNLPEWTRWTIEALSISLIAALIAINIPWGKFQSLFQSEIEAGPGSSIEVLQKVNFDHSDSSQEKSLENSENAEVAQNSEEPQSSEAAQNSEKDLEGSHPNNANQPKNANQPISKEVKPNKKMEPPTKGEAQGEVQVVESKPNQSGAVSNKTKGEIYRAFMKTRSLDEVTQEITQMIEKYGGEKAGEVKLGWRKKNGSYFHFKMPKKFYEELLSKLKKFSSVKVYKDPHPRVMPKGVFRMILWLEEDKSISSSKESNEAASTSSIESAEKEDAGAHTTSGGEEKDSHE